jgi:pimeloyl-ACP methyl ester carboxylesterase
LHSWGWRGQIDDLARMPSIVRAARPWLRIDPQRLYAVGGSMGGQETLLLVGRHPRLLAGAVAFDSVTDFVLRYRQFARIPRGRMLQALARIEVGGTPRTNAEGYVLRSPSHWVRQVAESGVPLQLWWSDADGIVREPGRQSGALYRKLADLDPTTTVEAFVGRWAHSTMMYATAGLPTALARFGLLPRQFDRLPAGVVRLYPQDATRVTAF